MKTATEARACTGVYERLKLLRREQFLSHRRASKLVNAVMNIHSRAPPRCREILLSCTRNRGSVILIFQIFYRDGCTRYIVVFTSFVNDTILCLFNWNSLKVTRVSGPEGVPANANEFRVRNNAGILIADNYFYCTSISRKSYAYYTYCLGSIYYLD